MSNEGFRLSLDGVCGRTGEMLFHVVFFPSLGRWRHNVMLLGYPFVWCSRPAANPKFSQGEMFFRVDGESRRWIHSSSEVTWYYDSVVPSWERDKRFPSTDIRTVKPEETNRQITRSSLGIS